MDTSCFFGKRLRELRKFRNLSAGELAPHLKCSPSLIYNIEKGLNRPQPELIVYAARFFGVTTDYMLKEDAMISEEELIKTYRNTKKSNKPFLYNLIKILTDHD
ncbi:MAG: helix-turn-helix transcriptional regulator [Desulfobacteraceae bacterium]|jgi:transcriptional regulator with XRE-family HTH domain